MSGGEGRTLSYDELVGLLSTIPDEPAEPTPAPVSPGRWSLRHAAVLRGFFAVPELVAHKGRRSGALDEDQVVFVREDCERARTPHGGRWRLSSAVRHDTVEHLGRAPEALLATLDGVPADPLDIGRTMAEAYLLRDAPPLEKQSLDELTGTRLAAEWLRDVRVDLPSAAEVGTQIQLTTLLAPLRSVLDAPIRGRESELRTLQDYADSRDGSPRRFQPLVIDAPGGMGKSALLATYLLERLERSPRGRSAAFAYLTFDRPDLSPQRPLDVLAEILRQLAIQVPTDAARCADLAEGLENLQVSISAAEQDPNRSRGTADVWRRSNRDVQSLVHGFAQVAREVTDGAPVCVLDTFERAQRQGPGRVRRLWELLADVAEDLPGLRVIVAGRGGVPNEDSQTLELTGLPDQAARSILLDRIGERSVPESLLDVVVRRARGNPLTLRLAAELIRRQATSLHEHSARRHFLQAFDEVEVQGVLYQRVLDHVDSAEARALAIPALVLRRITVDVVRHVLAPSAGLGTIDVPDAHRLYSILDAESSLLIEENGVLVHRQDVRAQVLPIIRRSSPTLVATVHRHAVAYYRTRTSTPDETEELYHRLALAQSNRTLESRWDDEAGVALYSVLQEEDLDPRVHVWLANKLGTSVDADVLRQADDDAWLVQAMRTARDLLDAGRPQDALDMLSERRPEPLDLTALTLEVEAMARLGRRLEAQELAVHGVRAAEERGDRAAAIRLAALAAQLAEDLADFGRALELLTDARSMAQDIGDVVQQTAAGVGMLRILRRTGRSVDPETVDLRTDVTALARTLTRKQRTSSPGLLRDLAAEIGQDAPEFVIEAATTLGVDVVSPEAIENLLANSKEEVAERIKQILGSDESIDISPDGGAREPTSHAQGTVIGGYLEYAEDSASSDALSEYYQLEADSPSFEDG